MKAFWCPREVIKTWQQPQGPVKTEMAVQSQLFLLFLDLSALFPAPAHGKPPACSFCPRPLPNTLHTTIMLASTLFSLCGPESPCTHIRQNLDPFRTIRLAQVLRETFSFGMWEGDTGYQNTMDSQQAGPHTPGVICVFSTGKLSPRPEGTLGILLL